MKCRDLMNVDMQWIAASAPVSEAARLMRDGSVGFLLVCDTSPGSLVGVVTDRDVTVRISAAGKSPSTALVSEAMSRPVVTCFESDQLSDAEDLMQTTEKSRVVVVDRAGTPVGILSLTDILVGDSPERAVHTARGILAREARGPHVPFEKIALTASSVEDEEIAAEKGVERPSVTMVAHRAGSMKEFP